MANRLCRVRCRALARLDGVSCAEKNLVSTTPKRGGLLLLCIKFIVLVVPLVWVWWMLLLPHYAEVLKQLAGGMLINVFSFPLDSGHVEVGGLFNTETKLAFISQGMVTHHPIAVLVANLPPYWALVLATAGLNWIRRVWILILGSTILVAGHVLFIVIAIEFMDTLAKYPEVPTAIAQFYITIPFLLWIVLAYWERVASYFGEPDQTTEAQTDKYA